MSDQPLTPAEVSALLREMRLTLPKPKVMPRTTGAQTAEQQRCHEMRVRAQADEMRGPIRVEPISLEERLKAIFGHEEG